LFKLKRLPFFIDDVGELFFEIVEALEELYCSVIALFMNLLFLDVFRKLHGVPFNIILNGFKDIII